jgi:trans-AT polyketide synthase/acyltransferase/oxidoreductase domain-containing protein
MVDRLGRAGLLGFFGAGGLGLDEIDEALHRLTASLGTGGRFGVNLLARPDAPEHEVASVELFLRHGVRHVEAAAFTQVTPAVVLFRFSGAHIAPDGTPLAVRHVVAKVSRPEVASAFMAPPPEGILDALLRDGRLTAAEAAAARRLPVAGDICAEADSGGHTDAANAFALVPAMTRLRDRMMTRHRYPVAIRVGAAGGIGSPEAAAAAFVLGADFVITGSVNQCTPEAGTSDAVKDLLSGIDVQDTTYAPAGDLFELGARVQVVRRGTLFAARANKLYSLYRQVPDLDAIDPETLRTIEERYFHRSVRSIWADLQATAGSETLEQGRRNGKARMAMVFRWYFGHSTRAAMVGSTDVADYQVHCGPAMGAFNRVVEGTDLEPWRARHVDAIAELIMTGAARALDVSSRAEGRR